MKNNGGAAFPTITEGSECGIKYLNYIPGMTLRQFYKGQALTGMMTNIPTEDNTEWPYNSELDPIKEIAKKTGEIADALIAEDEAFAAREG